MQKAKFSIEHYVFDKVTLDLENSVSNNFSIGFDTHGVFDSREKKYELIFSIVAFNEEKSVEQPIVKLRCRGYFVFENVETLDDVPPYFYRNAIAILFPYVRSYISVVTAQANMRPIILPTLNLVSLEDELKSNTIVK